MSFAQYRRQALALPPRVVLRRGGEILRRGAARAAQRVRDRWLPTFAPAPRPAGAALARLFAPPPLDLLRERSGEIAALTEQHLEHRFDLLGSGWTRVEHGVACRGVEGIRYPAAVLRELHLRVNRANRAEARRRRSLIDGEYRPIDWHLDFKSGYRWDERTWYRRVPTGHLPGADIKVPWELSRMQHLPLLAHAAALARAGVAGFRAPQVYARECRCQVLDFMAANPPRFGVNWACTMDVAIRAVNWLAAIDLFRAAGERFDAPFEDALQRSLEEHARFIAANLEWGVELRANHYLADLCGLLFIAAALPRSPQADAWLAFAVRELVVETRLQVNPDGSSFEGSTSYHRLAAEMLLYATALVLGLPGDRRAALAGCDRRLAPRTPGLPPGPLELHPLPGGGDPTPFSAEHFRRLERMAELSLHLLGPDALVPQIGDNDSGRFLKLFPAVRRTTAAAARGRYANLEGWAELPDAAAYWDEEACDHRHLLAACNGLFGRPDFAAAARGWEAETALVRALAGGAQIPSCNGGGRPAAEAVRVPTAGAPAARPAGEGAGITRDLAFPGGDLREGLRLAAYPDFGLWIFRSRRLLLVVRCGPIGQRGTGGHAHHDQLSLSLAVDGTQIIADPGTYLYTALPARRDEYRSVRAHFAPRAADGREPGSLDCGLFQLAGDPGARCLAFGEEGFLGTHAGFGAPVCRRVEILAASVRVTDWAGEGLELLPFEAHGVPPPLSPGYGKRLRR